MIKIIIVVPIGAIITYINYTCYTGGLIGGSGVLPLQVAIFNYIIRSTIVEPDSSTRHIGVDDIQICSICTTGSSNRNSSSRSTGTAIDGNIISAGKIDSGANSRTGYNQSVGARLRA